MMPVTAVSARGQFPNITTTYTTTASTADWLARLVAAVLQILRVRPPMPQDAVGVFDQGFDSP